MPCYQIFFIDEIDDLHCNLNGVRFIGRLINFCSVTGYGLVSDSDKSNARTLRVDFTNIEDIAFKVGSYYQVEAKIVYRGQPVTVRASKVRNVDGIDIQMYRDAVFARRRFL
ncbi:uncharacterized protein CEXT_278301 [Caerostris extrusa]|uniref:Uncharacterized protein n=1 Tax=Caerostris extrusa TaxID=172846 RepID=A0AAV4Y3B4_CAEEX|nr:uncharacterized protein CEXT_278301 [Caerostris extrusa]